MYEHKLNDHPNIPIGFNSKNVTSKEYVLNFLAEQNIELMEELLNLRGDLKKAVEVMNTSRSETQEVMAGLNAKIDNLEKVMSKKKDEEVPQPSITKPPTGPSSSSQSLPTFEPRVIYPKASGRAPRKMRGSAFLRKSKVLFIGDSVGHNTEFGELEWATKCRMRTVKAYSSAKNGTARWPSKNFADVTPPALWDTREDDPYTHLVLSAPTVDISNLDTSKLTDNDNLEEFHEHVILSCKNMIRTAETALKTHPNLDKVVIMEHAPRFDSAHVDPLGLKPDLAKFANITLRQLWFISPMKNKLQIGNHRLNYISNNVSEYYQDTKSTNLDPHAKHLGFRIKKMGACVETFY